MEAGRLAAHVAADLIELIGRHVEAVCRLPALGRCIFDHEVFASGSCHDALGHLDVATDPVLIVDDEITW